MKTRVSQHFAILLTLAACTDPDWGTPIGTGSTTEGDPEPGLIPCELESTAPLPPLPGCDPSIRDDGAAIRGSGAVFPIEAGCRDVVTIRDGPVTLQWDLTVHPETCPGGLVVESLADPTPVSLFAVSPLYEVRLAAEAPCNQKIGNVRFYLPESVIEKCPFTRVQFSYNGAEFTGGRPERLHTGDSLRIAAAHPCPGVPICDGHCLAPSVDIEVNEEYCGGCEPCEALCQAGECIAEAIPIGAAHSFATDGSVVYWSETVDGVRHLHAVKIEDGRPILEEVVGDEGVSVIAMDASPGAVAWVEEEGEDQRRSLRRLERRNADGTTQTVDVSFEVDSGPGVQPVLGATVLVASGPNPSLMAVTVDGSTPEPLSDCFDASLGPIRIDDLAADGDQVLVLGDDGDPDLESRDLWRCPLDGSPGTELVDDVEWPAQSLGPPWRLVLWESEILLVSLGAEAVYGIPAVGGAPYPVDVPGSATTPAVDGADLYTWNRESRSLQRGVGAQVEDVAHGVLVSDLAVVDGYLVFRDHEHEPRLVVLPIP